jgi:hypothetical protein
MHKKANKFRCNRRAEISGELYGPMSLLSKGVSQDHEFTKERGKRCNLYQSGL